MIRRAGLLLLVGWVVVVGLAVGVGVLLPNGGVPHVDRPLDEYFAVHRTAWLVSTMKVVTTVGSPSGVFAVTGAAAVVLLVLHRVVETVVLLIAVLGADAGEQVVKVVTDRHRPPLSLRVPDVSAHGLSFPSGHATFAAAGFGALALIAAASTRRRALQVIACVAGVLAAALVGLSRLYLGVHWPTDVLGGWALALAWLWVVVRAVRCVPRRWVRSS